MKGWTLEYIDELDEDIYHELVEWIRESMQPADAEASLDVDALREARRQQLAREGEESL